MLFRFTGFRVLLKPLKLSWLPSSAVLKIVLEGTLVVQHIHAEEELLLGNNNEKKNSPSSECVTNKKKGEYSRKQKL